MKDRLLTGALLVLLGTSLALAWTGKAQDGQALCLKAPDGHCAEPVLANDNAVTWATVTCPEP